MPAEHLSGPATLQTMPTIVKRWGPEHYVPSSSALLSCVALRPDDRALLEEFGLPEGPDDSLWLALRWESVSINHAAREVCSLLHKDVERGPHFPRTGERGLDWLELSQLVVLGEAPNDFSDRLFVTRYICVDSVRGAVWWVYPKLHEDHTCCCRLNSSLPGYLASLLAYKEFRDEWDEVRDEHEGRDDPNDDAAWDAYHARLKPIHTTFLHRLREADPESVDEFWEEHAWNESILMES